MFKNHSSHSVKFLHLLICGLILFQIGPRTYGQETSSQTTPSTSTQLTTSSSGPNITCQSAATSCLSASQTATGGSSGCGIIEQKIDCFSNTRNNNCTVDESVVTFDNFVPVFTQMCNLVMNASGSCLSFLLCVGAQTELATLQNSINNTVGLVTSQINQLTSTTFWCRYLQETLDCYLNNKVTCQFSDDDAATMTAQKVWVEETCSQKAYTVTDACQTEVTKCMTQYVGEKDCAAQVNELSCISRASKQCGSIADTSIVPFQELTPYLTDICKMIEAKKVKCTELVMCLETTEYAQIPNMGSVSGPSPAVYGQLLDSNFWCRYLKQSANCTISTSTTCELSLDEVNSIGRTYDTLANSCKGDDGKDGALHSDAVKLRLTSLLFSVIILNKLQGDVL